MKKIAKMKIKMLLLMMMMRRGRWMRRMNMIMARMTTKERPIKVMSNTGVKGQYFVST